MNVLKVLKLAGNMNSIFCFPQGQFYSSAGNFLQWQKKSEVTRKTDSNWINSIQVAGRKHLDVQRWALLCVPAWGGSGLYHHRLHHHGVVWYYQCPISGFSSRLACISVGKWAGPFGIQFLGNLPWFAGAEGVSQVMKGKVGGTIIVAAAGSVVLPPANITKPMGVSASHF